jgi:hypothetical protein
MTPYAHFTSLKADVYEIYELVNLSQNLQSNCLGKIVISKLP